jgi:diguanylate cyclase (GGDEF)-like protein/putative nucleotidyltransferase with HDIG domain
MFVSSQAKRYVILMATLGVLVLACAPSDNGSVDAMRFLCYLVGAAITSQLKVRLPGVTGTLSVNFFFIMTGIVELDVRRVLAIACAGALGQMLGRAHRRPRAVQVVFNLATVTIASYCAFNTYHWRFLQAFNGAPPIPLIAAALVFFLLNTLAVAGVLALTDGTGFWRIWRENFVWAAPQYMVVAALAGLVHVVDERTGWEIGLLLLPIIYLVYRSYDLYLVRLEEEKRHVTEMADLHLRTIEALAMAIDAKDDTTYDHLRRVKVYATEIGKEMQLSSFDLQALEAAALLHDIGKLAVPEYIISKPGKLTPEEFEKMKIHPLVGAEILQRVQFPYPVEPIVRSHHEKWNGSGYPDGLKGEEIPIGARILAVVDCLDALASDRQYRRAFPLPVALEKVIAESGVSFDPHVVEVLVRRSGDLERLAKAVSSAPARLSTNAHVERGGAPATGFETTGKLVRGESSMDFLASIAAARQEFHLLADLLNELGSSLSVDETLSLLAGRLKHMIPFDTVAIYVCRGERLKAQFVNGEEYRLFSALEIPLGQGLSGWVAENRRPIINGNPSVEPSYLNDPGKLSRLRSALAVPLEGVTGVAGVLTLYHAEADAFTRDHLRILQAISAKAGLAIENALRYRQVEDSAVTDQLTGLPNARSLFLQLNSELARSRRTGAPLVVMVLDLDGFKGINDRFGHLAGNKVLQRIAEGLRSVCREYDCVARMGGDEFVVILGGAAREAAVAKSLQYQQITREVGLALYQEDILSVSVGVACFPEDGENAEELLAVADKRMYQAKQAHTEFRPALIQ